MSNKVEVKAKVKQKQLRIPGKKLGTGRGRTIINEQ